MPDSRRLHLVRESFPDRPAFDTAVSRAILLRVAAGARAPTLRLARPGSMVAFGRQDVTSRGYGRAVRAARKGGFEAVERIAGGRAAVFHERTVALAHAVADPDPRRGTHARFEEAADIVARALRSLGVDARVGEVLREYCPGTYSVNARGRTKLMGVGQRLLRDAAHLGGVIVVGDAARVRDILLPVYDRLALDWNPDTVGSIEDEAGLVTHGQVVEALVAEYARRYDIVESGLDRETLALAAELEADHLSPAFERDEAAA